MIVMTGIEDVRKVIKTYEGKDLIETFKENQRKVAEQAALRAKQAPSTSSSQGLISRWLFKKVYTYNEILPTCLFSL